MLFTALPLFIALLGTVVHSGSEWDMKAVHSELKHGSATWEIER
jgi:hypothetical protein